jgi:protein-tyrosine phosphatase
MCPVNPSLCATSVAALARDARRRSGPRPRAGIHRSGEMVIRVLLDRIKRLRGATRMSAAPRDDTPAPAPKKIRVLFVCMGNVCRSPTARGVFEKMVADAGLELLIEVDSAGTYAGQIGRSADRRAVEVAARRGYDLSRSRARRIAPADLAMDNDNLRELREILPPGGEEKVTLFMDFAPASAHREVPDPYYGGSGGFERVLDLVEEAARGLLAHIRAHHHL